MKKIMATVIAIVLIGFPIVSFGAKKPQIDAVAAIAIDSESGRVFYQKDCDSRKCIASTTKMMTAIIALDNSELNEEVCVSKLAANMQASCMGLKSGEKLTMENLLYGLMLKSGNDASVAIAEHVGGSLENFVEMMNYKAKQIGLNDTHFMSPHGLDIDGHYSTARELALLAKYALKNKVFSKIVATSNISIANKYLVNTNDLLDSYQGVNGVKTGFTCKAGRCLVASANRDGFGVISVVLNCPTVSKRSESTRKLLDYVYNEYKPYVLMKKGQLLKTIPIEKGTKDSISIYSPQEVKISLAANEFEKVRVKVELPKEFKAPIEKGAIVGAIKCYLGKEELINIDLKLTEYMQKKQFKDYFMEMVEGLRSCMNTF